MDSSSVAFAPDGQSLVSGDSMGCCPRQWDVATGRELHVIGGHHSTVQWLSFSPDGKQLFSAAIEKVVLRWDVRSGRQERWFTWSTKDVAAVLPGLQRALKGSPSLELRRRLEQLQAKLNGQLLRLRRMVFALEQLGTSPACQLLADIASRKLDDQLTDEARAAVRRLQSAHSTKPKENRP